MNTLAQGVLTTSADGGAGGQLRLTKNSSSKSSNKNGLASLDPWNLKLGIEGKALLAVALHPTHVKSNVAFTATVDPF